MLLSIFFCNQEMKKLLYDAVDNAPLTDGKEIAKILILLSGIMLLPGQYS